MPLPDSISYLRRYQAWRKRVRGQSLTVGGFDREAISQCIDILINAAESTHILQKSLSSTRAQLQKCQVQREKLHSQLRKQASSPPQPT